MKKNKLKKFRFIIYLFFIGLIFKGCTEREVTIHEEVASPNGLYTAYAYSFEGGATTSFNKIVSIIGTDEKDKEKILVSKDANVYFNMNTLNQDIDISWSDDSTLIVKVNEEKENIAYIKMKADIVNGIKISYE